MSRHFHKDTYRCIPSWFRKFQAEFFFLPHRGIAGAIPPLQPLWSPWWAPAALIPTVEYAAEYLALPRRYKGSRGCRGTRGQKATSEPGAFPSSLEITELWKAVSSAALLNTVRASDTGIIFLKSLRFLCPETQMFSKWTELWNPWGGICCSVCLPGRF